MKTLNVMARSLVLLTLLISGLATEKSLALPVIPTGIHAISGGTLVSLDHPLSRSTVAISSVHKKFVCTGSIIADQFILTAAHCLMGPSNELLVYFGAEVSKPVKVIGVSSARGHESFVPDPQGHKSGFGDIAVLKLSQPVPQGFHPLGLFQDPNQNLVPTNAAITLMGFGLDMGLFSKWLGTSGILRTVSIPLEEPYFTSEYAKTVNRQKGVCQGDSGGPVYLSHDGKTEIFAIVSAGTVGPLLGGCTGTFYFTRVSKYLPWIKATMASLQ